MASSAVFGLFSTKEQVETAIDEMKQEGFRGSDISVLFPYKKGTKDFSLEKRAKVAEVVKVSPTPGVVVGSCEFVRIAKFRQVSGKNGALEWLAGIGVLAIPGVGPFVTAGPIMAVLGNDASIADGGMTGTLIGMGVEQSAAARYEGRIKGGNILLSVHTDNSTWIRKARKILDDTGADDIASTGEANVH
jgi:hypothetical protein